MNVTISAEALEKAAVYLRNVPRGLPRAVSLALNRTLEGMRTDAVRETRARYHAKAGDIRKTLTLKRASAGGMEAVMLSRGARRSLADYKVTPMKPKRGQLLLGAVKSDGLKPLGGVFLIRRGGKARPYRRIGTGRWDIESLMSPAIPQILKNEETVAAMEKGAGERFSKRLEHETFRLLGVVP